MLWRPGAGRLQVCTAASGAALSWEELAIELAGRALRLASSGARDVETTAEVARAVRLIDRHPEAPLTLDNLARSYSVQQSQ